MNRVCAALIFCCMISAPVFSQDRDSIEVDFNPFNPGLILSLPQAIQSQVPGLLVARPGSNPNGGFDMIYRGYNSFRNRMQPLLMLDGIPGISWHLVDPFLMDSVSVRRGSQLVQMGMQASAGVFDAAITNPANQGLSVTFLQNVSVENYQRSYDNLSAAEFRREAPSSPTLGDSNTDWLDALTRTAWSTNTGLKLGYNATNLNSRVLISQRNVNGIQPNTGFGQLSIYGGLDYSLLKGKIKIGGSTLIVDRDSELGNTDFFQGAVAMNPTLALDAPINFFTSFGGNPWLRMNLDKNTLESKMNMFQGYVVANPTNEWTIKGRIGQVSTDKNQFRYFGLNEASGNPGILQRRRERQDTRNFAELSTDYLIQRNAFTLNPGVRFTSQRISYNVSGNNVQRLWNPENTIEKEDIPINFGTYSLNAVGFFLKTNLGEKLNLDFLFQSEGSSNLGENAQWGNFFGMDINYQLSSKFQLFGSYAHTGMIPGRTGLSQTVFQIEPYPNFIHFENPDMKWEDTYMWELGGKGMFLNGKLYGEFRYFNSKSSDFINYMKGYDWPYSTTNNYYPFTYQNFGEIRNRGTEWLIQLNPVKIGTVFYQSSINATFLKSEWIYLEGEFVSLEGIDVGISRNIGGNPFFQYNTLRTGEAIGTVRALNFQGIDRNTGQWILERTNQGEDWRSDYVPQGRGVPRWWMGWNHQVSWKKWRADLLLRGVFGHVNVNESDFRYGNLNFSNNNALRTFEKTKAMGLTDYNTFNNFFIEPSNFLSIHFLAISRELNFLWGKNKINSTLSLIGNNLFYFTKYSGADPEARIVGRPIWQFDEHVEVSESYFAPGIDPSSTWLPSRAYTLSYQIRF